MGWGIGYAAIWVRTLALSTSIGVRPLSVLKCQ